MATTKLRIFLPPSAPLQEIQIKAADWDTFEIDANENLVVKLGTAAVAVYLRGQYVGAVRLDAVAAI